MSVRATCSHCALPVMLMLVSSTPITAASVISVLISFSTSPRASAARATCALTHPVDGAAPVRSAISWAARSTGTCWYTTRYTATARRFGPYTAGPWTPAGAAAVLTFPHRQARRCNRCSTTRTSASGTSRTCRTTTPAGAASPRSAPQPPHAPGRWSITSSGSVTISSVEPGAPGCLPGFRFEPRRGRDGPRPRSVDGGNDELPEFCPSSLVNSATCAVNAWTCSVSVWISVACSATTTSNCSRVS